jgi:cob(I)alamin adenosyltransferase
MPIYTKTGDHGTTSLYGGRRVLKSDLRVESYGSIDELSSFIGLIATRLKNKDDKNFLNLIQKDLYQIMAILSGADKNLSYLEKKVVAFEQRIDEIKTNQPKLNGFILPGGTEFSAWFHILRTVCRRVERNVVRFLNNLTIKQFNNKTIIIKYLNRLSDLFFMFARFYNNGKDILT